MLDISLKITSDEQGIESCRGLNRPYELGELMFLTYPH